LKRFYQSFYVTRRFYLGIAAIVMAYVFAFFLPLLLWPVFLVSNAFLAAALLDAVLLYSRRKAVTASRKLAERLSNGDDNPVTVHLHSHYPFQVRAIVIDELPVQFQNRHFALKTWLKPAGDQVLSYDLHPVERGEYGFGELLVFVQSFLGLIERKIAADKPVQVACYPSYIQLRRFQLLAATNRLHEAGSKQVRKIGHSIELEKIKEYVPGDDYRTINWRASARSGSHSLMVNNYTDERSQPVYCIINSGRVMKMPFAGLSLLDYAINATLVLTNIALSRHDKAGLITYGDTWLHHLPAASTRHQMNSILHRLYNLQTNFLESNIERLYATATTRVTSRSLLFYFTNYETLSALERDLPYLRMLNRRHLLLVIFFENTELRKVADEQVNHVEGVYRKIVAEKFVHEKRLIVKELQKHGILSVLTAPQQLSVSVINKYLEVKARQMV
jgi:uncharacterized protein (DUF58 family)